MGVNTHLRIGASDGLLKHILRGDRPVREPGVGFPHRDHISDPITILRLIVRIDRPPPRSDHRTRGWGSLVAVCSQSNLLGKNEVFDRSPIIQDLLPGGTTVPLDLAEILGSEQNPSMSVRGNADSTMMQPRTSGKPPSSSFGQAHHPASRSRCLWRRTSAQFRPGFHI